MLLTKWHFSPHPTMAHISRQFPTQTICKYMEQPEPSAILKVRRRAQYAVLTKHLGVKKLHCVVGFSMGGQQVR